jgi:hypothetical protein
MDTVGNESDEGIVGALLAAIMAVLGPATALVVDAARFTATGRTPEFLAVQLSDIVAFAGLTGAALLLRRFSSGRHRWANALPCISRRLQLRECCISDGILIPVFIIKMPPLFGVHREPLGLHGLSKQIA